MQLSQCHEICIVHVQFVPRFANNSSSCKLNKICKEAAANRLQDLQTSSCKLIVNIVALHICNRVNFFTVPGYLAEKTGGSVIRDQHYVMHLFWRSRTRSGQPAYRLICRFSRLTGKPRHHCIWHVRYYSYFFVFEAM